MSTLSTSTEGFDAYMNGDADDEIGVDFIMRCISEDSLDESDTHETHETHKAHEVQIVAPDSLVSSVPSPVNATDVKRKRPRPRPRTAEELRLNRVSAAASRQRHRDELKTLRTHCNFLMWENHQLRCIFDTSKNYGFPLPPPTHISGKIALPKLTHTSSKRSKDT